jgi:alcohol dehydrogenase class IV
MNFDFFMPVRIFSGTGCIKKNSGKFNLGRRCIIVTGRSSARLSGALDDVADVLREYGIEYTVFDRVQENPLVSICEEGGRTAIKTGAEFVIGIGGGSALDAAKAVAAYAANKKVHGEALFTEAFAEPLPLIAVPTTAGTGSEANNYSVLSLDGKNKKRTFKTDYSYPVYAFLDAKYTMSLGAEYTLSTALDAFCHCIESYMSPKSTVFSEAAAVYGAAAIWNVLAECFAGGNKKPFSYEQREALLYASCAAGAAINTTGTGFPHPMGYNLTMFRGIPHGRACAAFTGAFVDFTAKNEEGRRHIDEFCNKTGITAEAIKNTIPSLAPVVFKLSDEEIEMFVRTVNDASNFSNNYYPIGDAEAVEIYKALFQ